MSLNGWRDRRRTARRRLVVGDDVALLGDRLSAIEAWIVLPLETAMLAEAVVPTAEEHAALLRVLLGLTGRAA